jgi:uncharacterized integral membrane protein
MSRPRLIVIGLLVLLVLVFVFQNSEVVAVKVLFWEFPMSRVILILLATAVGFAAGFLACRVATRARV